MGETWGRIGVAGRVGVLWAVCVLAGLIAARIFDATYGPPNLATALVLALILGVSYGKSRAWRLWMTGVVLILCLGAVSTERKLKRRECDDLIRDGVPIMTDVYPAGLVWWDEADAQARWVEISPMLVNRRLPSVHEGWVAHVWESENGDPVVHFDGWH